MKREKVNITHNGNTLLALVKWNILFRGGKGIANFFLSLSLQRFISDFWRGTRERGVQLTRCKDKSPTPFDSFISLPLFLFVYLKIFKDLLFEEGGTDFLSFHCDLWAITLTTTDPSSPFSPLFCLFQRSRKKRERRPVRGEVRRRFRVIHCGVAV